MWYILCLTILYPETTTASAEAAQLVKLFLLIGLLIFLVISVGGYMIFVTLRVDKNEKLVDVSKIKRFSWMKRRNRRDQNKNSSHP